MPLPRFRFRLRTLLIVVVTVAALLPIGCSESKRASLEENVKPDETAIAEAKRHPNGWVYAIEPGYDPNGAVPPEAIKGAWRVDANGDITGEFMPNPNYRLTKKKLEP